MKKLMIIAAAAAMTLTSEAALKLRAEDCDQCGGGTDGKCIAVFKVTGSGKAEIASKDDYKTVGSLKIKKGALALLGTYCESDDTCCYEVDNGHMFYATIKAGKSTFHMQTGVQVPIWSIFGKKYDSLDSKEYKKGGKFKMDSALFITSDGTDLDTDSERSDWDDFAFWAAAFGKVEVKISKKNENYCNTSECDPSYKVKSYSGWFVGQVHCDLEEYCFLCACEGMDVFGGTWKASLSSKTRTLSGARKLAGVSAFLEGEDED